MINKIKNKMMKKGTKIPCNAHRLKTICQGEIAKRKELTLAHLLSKIIFTSMYVNKTVRIPINADGKRVVNSLSPNRYTKGISVI